MRDRLGPISAVADRLRSAGWRRVFGRELDRAKYVHWMTQWYPWSVVSESAWTWVSEIVAYAATTSPYYRSRLNGMDPTVPLTADAFQRIPPLTRQDVVASWAAIQVPGSRRSHLNRHSGGTTGLSVQVPLDAETYSWYVAGTWRGLRWWGSDFTERGAVLLGPPRNGLGSLATRAKDWVMNWLRIPVNDSFDDHATAILGKLAAFRPAFIYGYPSAVHRLAHEIHEHGRTPSGRLKVIILTGEPVYAFQRRTIERAFQCPVAEEYGNGELGSMGFECPEGRQVHVSVENVYLETVRRDHPVCDDGDLLLATQLRNHLFPLIRYETGDVGSLSEEPCPCGRGLPVVRVLGRARDYLLDDHGTRSARPLLESLLNGLPENLQGRVRVNHARAGSVVLEVERNGAPDVDAAGLERLARDVLGAEWHVRVATVDRLHRLPSGKLPYFARKPPR